ncbi:MAG: hypothetical protein IT364_20650 [Candidatus Hydrogenedentes bacterium]|nr:hypothetical protein [Candidatus Hydrogenedentota bacterium]
MPGESLGPEIVEECCGPLRVARRAEVPLDRILEALRAPGELLKASRKSETLRVNDWAVKRSRKAGGLGVLKHTFRRARYRQAWEAALHLERHGVPIPLAHAYIERSRMGIIFGNMMVMDYLDGCVDVEAFADGLLRAGASDAELHGYLERLAETVNLLCSSGAYHNDLAGKNILTPDGEQFYFIDLDGIVLNRPYTEERRLQNHIQLYDSFIDRLGDGYLDPFIRQMLPRPGRLQSWMTQVKSGQAARRARTEAIWAKQGGRRQG